MNTLIVIGNGFDLNFGLETSYAKYIDFAYSSHFYNDDKDNTLLNSIHEEYEKINWIDIELSLRELAINNPCTDKIRKSYQLLCESLKYYMKSDKYPISFSPNGDAPVNESCAYRLLQWINDQKDYKIYSLNYTPLSTYKNNSKRTELGNIDSNNFVNIHGIASDDSNIILGIDPSPEIPQDYAFMMKPLRSNYTEGLISALDEAPNVIFFGVGFGITDFPYFRQFFSSIEKGTYSKNIHVFSLRNGNEHFYSQLRRMGIDITCFREITNGKIHFYDTSLSNSFQSFEDNFTTEKTKTP